MSEVRYIPNVNRLAKAMSGPGGKKVSQALDDADAGLAELTPPGVEAIDEARRAGVLCSYDPNLRLNLWPNARVARQAIRTILPLADVVKVNEEELDF